MNKTFLLWLACSGLTMPAVAQDLDFALPESVGLSSAVLDTATARLQRHIDNNAIPGAVAAVARDSKIVYFQALGMQDVQNRVPLPDNTLFRQYSMTRQITSTAVLMLWEQGHFEFDDPIKMYLPRFEGQQVFVNPDNPDLSQTRERTGDITVAHLLTHTSGIGSRSSAIYRDNNVRDRNITLQQMADNAAGLPLFEDPGTRFRYGISTTILGLLVEVWSGMPFEDYLQENIFEPLQMSDTVFHVDPSRADRLAVVYRPDGSALAPYRIEPVPFTDEPALIEGGVGLVSTAMDYLRFSQMVLNKGVLNGNRIMEEATAELYYRNAVPERLLPLNTRGYWLGSGWSLGGFNVVLNETAYDHPVSSGTIWWDGSAGTRYWIDPAQNMAIVVMAQISPAHGDGFREDFKRLVNGSILQRR
ncbi:MAG: serine hydrolase domain-containing protein [Pseudohongiellaceae bacterium]